MLIEIRTDMDVARARREAMAAAKSLGMDRFAQEALAISVLELGTNQLRHAGSGQMRIDTVEQAGRRGIEMEAADTGPGIADVACALQDACSTSGSMGSGLPAVRRLMDDFQIDSQPGQGTRIVVHKWVE